MLYAQQPSSLFDPVANLATRQALTFERKSDVLLHVHMRIESKQLKYERNVSFRSAAESDVLAVEQNASVGRKLETGDHAKRRCFAAT